MNEFLALTAFTIITPNYLAHAYALRQSFLNLHPGSSFVICLIGTQQPAGADEKEMVLLKELKDERIEGMIQRYNPFELSCALKPYFAEHLLTLKPDSIRFIYLDSDIGVFGRFDQQTQAAVTISPHRTKNVNYLPGLDNFSTTELLRYGVYNAGYFEITRSNEAKRFLSWWQQLLEHFSYNKPDKHIFTDQLWLSVVPSFFDDVYINKKPGFNVGFWNLIERTVEYTNNQWLVNGEPLVFYHFSRYKLELPDNMVDFNHPMLSFQSKPQLKILYDQYREQILNEGYETLKQLPYPYPYPAKEKKSWWKKLFR